MISFLCYTIQTLKNNEYPGGIYAMYETAVFFDAVRSTTLEINGKEDITLASTGHDKQNINVALTYPSDGIKKVPYIVFKGKGKTKEDLMLQKRSDIFVTYSDNGWFNEETTLHFIDNNFGGLFKPKTLLVWDSYRCHISGPVKERLKKYNFDSLVIPGGCTKFVQTLDVSANAPFKSKISEEYDAWQAKGTKTYTQKGNVRAATKSILCDWVVSSWKSLSKDLVIKSFIVCG